MKKKKLNAEPRKQIMQFLEKHVTGIVEAEVQTYKDTPVSSHTPRMYVFSTHSVGIVEIELDKSDPLDKLVRTILLSFKTNEEEKLRAGDDDMIYGHYVSQGGSSITGLVLFLPGIGVHVDKTKMDTYPIHIQEKIKNGTLDPTDIPEDNMCNGIHIRNMLNVNYVSFYTSEISIYNIISHNDEVIDMPALLEKNTEAKSQLITMLEEFIEIE